MNKITILGISIAVIIALAYVGYSSSEKDAAEKQKLSDLIDSQNLLFDIINLDTLDYNDDGNSITMFNAKYALNPEKNDIY
ncbi:hypothetical protein [Nitrosopumilus ureiphilus]|uniref:Uncharacterized protein n=1 Tax=Nitrosopumilus ureiphilus TaxID=1470067 RepID=A0A7D5M572_9ARCH|nr:hypothetical protein [Nitrosopumilus ureiphilus]QLH07426.1 hypothetical protein C5F50_10370 [Nitrosopumilus ureiphilus]